MTIKQKIEQWKEEVADDDLMQYVADDVLEQEEDEEIKSYIEGVLAHWCQSGRVTSLIYHSQTFAFFDKFYEEIERLRHEYEEDMGMKLEPKGHYLKNRFARWAYEETTRKIADYLGLER